MRVIYNGVDMMALETHEYYFESVYDNSKVDYLYTRVTLLITALINGDTRTKSGNGPFMSYKFEGQASAPTPGDKRFPTPFFTPDVNLNVPAGEGLEIGSSNQIPRGIAFTDARPFTTQEAVRHRLLTPRGQLYVFEGDGIETGRPAAGTLMAPPSPALINLASPSLNRLPGTAIGLISEGIGSGVVRKCDCRDGPFPQVFGITQVMSQDNTFVVDWGIETFINEAQENSVSPSGGLLSNRFKQTHSVNDDGFTVVVTEGEAIFRTDFVYGLGQNPDSQRAVLFMPIPHGFVREILYVTVNESVTGLDYAYKDTQVPVNFVAGSFLNGTNRGPNASKIAAVHRQAVTANADVLTGALSAYERTVGILLNNKWLRDQGQDRPAKENKPKKPKKDKPKR